MRTFYIIVLTLAFATGFAQQKKGVELVKPAEFAKKIESKKGQLIDVRTPKEYNSGHIKNAANIHLYDKDFEQRIAKLDKNKTVYVYCKAGGRSSDAVEILKDKGFLHIVELDGGTDAWSEAGKPLEK